MLPNLVSGFLGEYIFFGVDEDILRPQTPVVTYGTSRGAARQ